VKKDALRSFEKKEVSQKTTWAAWTVHKIIRIPCNLISQSVPSNITQTLHLAGSPFPIRTHELEFHCVAANANAFQSVIYS
jgi:hypothetical protein